MALNAKKVKGGGGGNKVEQPALEAGTYPVRLVQVIDLGIQVPRPFKGEQKPPIQMIHCTYEFTDEFMLDEEGEPQEDKPRWVSEEFPLHNLGADRATSTRRYKALDPQEAHEGDWTELLGEPANALITTNVVKSGPNQGKERNYIKDLSAMRPKDAKKTPDLVNEPKFFSLDEPDLEVFLSLPDFLQEKIKGNLEYNGSVLQGLLEGDKPKGKGKPSGTSETGNAQDGLPDYEEEDAEELTGAVDTDDGGEDAPW